MDNYITLRCQIERPASCLDLAGPSMGPVGHQRTPQGYHGSGKEKGWHSSGYRGGLVPVCRVAHDAIRCAGGESPQSCRVSQQHRPDEGAVRWHLPPNCFLLAVIAPICETLYTLTALLKV